MSQSFKEGGVCDIQPVIKDFDGNALKGPHSMALSEKHNTMFFTDSGPLGETSLEKPHGSIFAIDLGVSMLKPVLFNSLSHPTGIVVSNDENILYVSETGQNRIDCVTKVSQLPAWKAHLSSASVVWSEKVPTSVKLFSNTKWGEQQKQTAKWLLEYMLKVEPTVTDKALEPTSGGLSNFDASMAKYDMRVLFCPYTSLQNGTPDFNQAKRNLKIKCFKSIKPSVIMWLVQVFGSHKEAFKILQEFLQVPHGYMKDLDFLALYVSCYVYRTQEAGSAQDERKKPDKACDCGQTTSRTLHQSQLCDILPANAHEVANELEFCSWIKEQYS